jgi:hypothetical protein
MHEICGKVNGCGVRRTAPGQPDSARRLRYNANAPSASGYIVWSGLGQSRPADQEFFALTARGAGTRGYGMRAIVW